jgi:hypothetical protein
MVLTNVAGEGSGVSCAAEALGISIWSPNADCGLLSTTIRGLPGWCLTQRGSILEGRGITQHEESDNISSIVPPPRALCLHLVEGISHEVDGSVPVLHKLDPWECLLDVCPSNDILPSNIVASDFLDICRPIQTEQLSGSRRGVLRGGHGCKVLRKGEMEAQLFFFFLFDGRESCIHARLWRKNRRG